MPLAVVGERGVPADVAVRIHGGHGPPAGLAGLALGIAEVGPARVEITDADGATRGDLDAHAELVGERAASHLLDPERAEGVGRVFQAVLRAELLGIDAGEVPGAVVFHRDVSVPLVVARVL